MNELALFAGAGGGILGGLLLGWRTVCAVEYNEHARDVLVARQNDGCLSPFPIWDDVRTFDGKPWRGIVDVVSGGFPCQDISIAGNGKGLDGERSGLWAEFKRIISEVRPKYAFVENSPALTFRGLGRVLGDLAEMGYNAKWGMLGHNQCGGMHRRERIWIVANLHEEVVFDVGKCKTEIRKQWETDFGSIDWINFRVGTGDVAPSKWESEGNGFNPESTLVRKSNGVAYGLDRLARIGNGQVPAVVRKAWHVLCQERIGPKR